MHSLLATFRNFGSSHFHWYIKNYFRRNNKKELRQFKNDAERKAKGEETKLEEEKCGKIGLITRKKEQSLN
jgi:hypothetical protein